MTAVGNNRTMNVPLISLAVFAVLLILSELSLFCLFLYNLGSVWSERSRHPENVNSDLVTETLVIGKHIISSIVIIGEITARLFRVMRKTHYYDTFGFVVTSIIVLLVLVPLEVGDYFQVLIRNSTRSIIVAQMWALVESCFTLVWTVLAAVFLYNAYAPGRLQRFRGHDRL